MISVDGLAVEFGGTTLFKDISFAINEKDRIALMGKNGAGKSTLLKILAGERTPSRGVVSAPNDAVIAYLPQHLMTDNKMSVFEETSQAFAHIFEMEAKIEAMNAELASRTDYESPEYYKLIEDVTTLSEKFYSIEEVNYQAEVEKILIGLGFVREDFNRPTSDFSGGWRMRIELAKILLKKPDLSMALNGMLAGLVGITAGADSIAPWPAVLVGAIAGILVVVSVLVLDKAKIDDPVGAISVRVARDLR